MSVNIKIIPSFTVKNVRKILYPLSLPYKAVTALRNMAFDKGLLGAKTFPTPIIGVGNLSTGGTGKTPMTEYLVRLLMDKNTTAILSRGYGRKTTGFLEVVADDDARRVGDEPLQFKSKFPRAFVAVDEKRTQGIDRLGQLHPEIDIFLLDDVFQHRSIRPGLMILLTAYTSPFYDDLVLPAGNLREARSGAERADIIVVTKCPTELSAEKRADIFSKIRKYANCPVFFSTVEYDHYIFGTEMRELKDLKGKDLTVVTGIARPQPFVKHLRENGLTYELKTFGDHHNFSSREIAALDKEAYLLTTEKDYVRLKRHLTKADLFFLPIKHRFLDGGQDFEGTILKYAEGENGAAEF